MLVLSRKPGERVVIGYDVAVVVLEVRGNRVKLGFECPVDVPVHRQELLERPFAGCHVHACVGMLRDERE